MAMKRCKGRSKGSRNRGLRVQLSYVSKTEPGVVVVVSYLVCYGPKERDR